MTAAIALALLAGCRTQTAPASLLRGGLAPFAAGREFGLDWTLTGGGRGTLDVRGDEAYWTFRDASGEYRYRRDARRSLAIRPAEHRYSFGPPRPWDDLRLGEAMATRLPPFAAGGVGESDPWTASGDGKTLSRRVPTEGGFLDMELAVGSDGRFTAMRYLGPDKKPFREWRVSYRPARALPSFDPPAGFVPDGLDPEPSLPDAGTPFPGLGAGPRRLVLVTGDDAPSKRASARTWTIPVVRKKVGETGVPVTATPAWYLVDGDGKIVRRWVGEGDEIVDAVRAAIIAP